MTRTAVTLFLVVAIDIGTWLVAQSKPTGESTPFPEEARKRLLSLLPAADHLGARLTQGPVFYRPGNLYSYINGGAEAFLAYDFVALAHAVYQKRDAEITVDVYDMGRPDNAFGIYASERSPDYPFITIGAEGYQGDLLINFLHDRYYVKLSAWSETEKGAAILEPFARQITSAVGTAPLLPKQLSLFPAAHLLPHTQTFVLRSPLGRDFLSPAYSARYSFASGSETTVVLSFAESEEAALPRLAQLCAQAKTAGQCVTVDEPAGGIRGSTPYEGDFLAFPKGSVVVIILDPPAAGTGLVAQLLRALEP